MFCLVLIAVAVDACLPEDKRASVHELLEDEQKGFGDDVLIALARILIATVVLVVGWVVHTFLL
jgi:hypothetical protein